ncbi:MAG: DMT family transporter, partial [Firmicutes bacterium]|nr:DMT family transporter [Bacillota bacterium]
DGFRLCLRVYDHRDRPAVPQRHRFPDGRHPAGRRSRHTEPGSFLFESPHLPQNAASWASILTLAIVCSGFGFTLQPVAQSGTSAETAGLLCALNPLVASVLGVVFLHEVLSAKAILGGLLVLAGIILYSVKTKPAE